VDAFARHSVLVEEFAPVVLCEESEKVTPKQLIDEVLR